MRAGDDRVVVEGWITTEEGVAITGYHAKYLQELARRGRVKARKIAPRAWLINEADLLRYKAEMEALGDKRHDPRRNPQWLESKRRGRRKACSDD